jgi:filamentous hemagglutinin
MPLIKTPDVLIWNLRSSEREDLYNRQLHPEERTLIANAANEIAASQGQNPADQAQITTSWNNLLTLAVNADVDAQGQQQLSQTASQMTLAPQASGNYQDLQTFQQNLATALSIIQGMSGRTITHAGGPIVADDEMLKTLQPTGSQYNDSSLFGTPGGTKIGLATGQTPASVSIGAQFYIAPSGPTNQQVSGFVSDLIQQAAAPNGAVTPVYSVESAVLGNMASKVAWGALDAVLGDSAVTLVIRSRGSRCKWACQHLGRPVPRRYRSNLGCQNNHHDRSS